ncbi:hypothetical protein TraAM80_06301 [Trypanosoma rangeli]|uniref:Uncharacterized protein n=1 Tax=Trypanosoma rangeli TaxID=5698 RepID=A0A422NAR3_TRYRA|nr:uncharacterized protein TraAM80_06301 [Trypanosoma rangeli]RNF02568.1 hypothetical protein TraAM80_06301 [Trypanosoma rangeli]|eukprot:RNF02568.1 hypothetical protein TraAM80_06301 [Trypanosoma rangeli]
MMDGNDHRDCTQPSGPVTPRALCGADEFVELRHYSTLNEPSQMHTDDLHQEETVRSEVAVQLAEKVVVLRRQLQRREAEIQALKSGIETGVGPATHGVAATAADGLPDGACNSVRAVTPVKTGLLGVEQATEFQCHRSTAELQQKLSEMETKGALWRQRVKEALRTSQRREQALLAENIALQQRAQKLQERLNEAMFRIEACALKNARQTTKVSCHSQTNEFTEDAESDKDLCCGDTLVMSDTGITLSLRQPRHSSPRPTTRAMSYVVASMESLAAAATAAPTVAPMLPEFLSDGDPKSPLRFPYPPPSLLLKSRGNSNPNSNSTNDSSLNYALEITSRDPGSQAKAPPLIVAVHYNNSEGWSVQTKVRVSPGMTVTKLKEYCCSLFNERYQLQLDAVALCVRYYHAKANRHVVLSAYRELHSFACFQRCEREQIHITLQLVTEDRLARLVHDTMNVATVSMLNSPRDPSE